MRETKSSGGPSAVPREYNRKTASATKRRRPRDQTPDYVRRRKNAVLALIGVILLVVMAVWLWESAGEIRRGTRVGEVDVGGMTREEAREAVERHAAGAFEEIRFGDGVFSLSGEELGVKVDAASAVGEAYSVGREGWAGKRVFDVLRSYLGGIQLDLNVEYEEEVARDVLESSVAREFYERPQNATFRLRGDGQVEVQEARQGRVLDQEGTLSNLDRALADMSSEVPIAADYKKPEVSTQEVQGLKPTQVIGEYRTDFLWDSNPSRQANMKLAAGAINNTLLAPGEVFSFNELASELDYASAKTFSDGGVAYADGGGLCQVSSTLYMAAQYAGLEIVERHPHYAVLPYIKPGFDATVWFGEPGSGWGEQDMRFKNTTDAYVLVREYVDEKGFLNAEIWGQPTGKKVEMRTEKIFERPERGIKWATYKTLTNKDGEVLFDGLIHEYIYSYNPPAPEGGPHYDTSIPRVSGWKDPTNTTGWNSPH
ncbi:MAG: VanW family protein [Actinomycetota bacterium]|nr:VanW family protein [Actinomycetota bacterium]